MEPKNVVLYTDHEVDIHAQNRLMVSCREAQFREDPNLAPDPHRLKYYLNAKRLSVSKKLKRWYHVKVSLGVNGEPSPASLPATITRMRDAIEKLAWAMQAAYCFEYITKDGSNGHPHCHIVCESHKCGGHIQRDLSATMGVAKNFVSVYPLDTEKYRSNTLKYIQKNRLYDIAWRGGHGIRPLYLHKMSQEDFDEYSDR